MALYGHREPIVPGLLIGAKKAGKPGVVISREGVGAHTIKKGRGVLPGTRDPYPFPDTIETPFQTKVRRAYRPTPL